MAKEYIMKVRKVSTHSYAVTLPKEVIKKFGWKERQKLVLRESGKKIIIRDWE